MTREDAINWLVRRGYQKVSSKAYGKPGADTRYVLGPLVLRYEVKSGSGWVMTRHGYYSKMHLTNEDKLSGFKPWHL